MHHKHGAVAFYKGRVVGIGHNARRTSALQRLYANKVGKPFHLCVHAEVSAIDCASGKADTMIVVRVSKSGNLLDSKPCSICTRLIKDIGVKRVYYSFDGGIRCMKIS